LSRLIGKDFYIFIIDPAEVTPGDAIPLDWLIPPNVEQSVTRATRVLNIDNDPTTMCNVMDKCSNHLLSLLL